MLTLKVFETIPKSKHRRRKILLVSFQSNSHALEFRPLTEKLEPFVVCNIAPTNPEEESPTPAATFYATMLSRVQHPSSNTPCIRKRSHQQCRCMNGCAKCLYVMLHRLATTISKVADDVN